MSILKKDVPKPSYIRILNRYVIATIYTKTAKQMIKDFLPKSKNKSCIVSMGYR
jgi:hypothetical protein